MKNANVAKHALDEMTPYERDDMELDGFFRQVIKVLEQFEDAHRQQIKECGSVVQPKELQKIFGNDAISRLARRLYGLWLTEPIETVKDYFEDWIDDELSLDEPDV